MCSLSEQLHPAPLDTIAGIVLLSGSTIVDAAETDPACYTKTSLLGTFEGLTKGFVIGSTVKEVSLTNCTARCAAEPDCAAVQYSSVRRCKLVRASSATILGWSSEERQQNGFIRKLPYQMMFTTWDRDVGDTLCSHDSGKRVTEPEVGVPYLFHSSHCQLLYS